MKILVITKPRTRSSFLCSALSNYYDIKNYHEPFNFIEQEFVELRTRFGLLKKKLHLQDLVNYQKKNLTQKIKNLNVEESYVCKLMPRNILFSYRGTVIREEQPFEHEIYLNFNEILKIQDYDKVYFLNRDVIDSSISFIFAQSINSFLFANQSDLNYQKKKNQKMIVSQHGLDLISFVVYECVLLEKIKEFLDKEKIPYTYIDYVECTEYVRKNLNCNKPNMYLESNFNYKELIENYSECVKHIENKYKEFKNQLKYLEFVRN